MYGSQTYGTTEYGGARSIQLITKRIISALFSSSVSLQKQSSKFISSNIGVSFSLQKSISKTVNVVFDTSVSALKMILFNVISTIIIGVASISKTVNKNIISRISYASDVATKTIIGMIISAIVDATAQVSWAWDKTMNVIIEAKATVQKITYKNILSYAGVLAIVKDMFYKIKYPKNNDTYSAKYTKNSDTYTKKYY